MRRPAALLPLFLSALASGRPLAILSRPFSNAVTSPRTSSRFGR